MHNLKNEFKRTSAKKVYRGEAGPYGVEFLDEDGLPCSKQKKLFVSWYDELYKFIDSSRHLPEFAQRVKQGAMSTGDLFFLRSELRSIPGFKDHGVRVNRTISV